MKPWWILVALVALVGVAPASPPPPEPPFENYCIGPMSWDALQKCIGTYEPGAKLRELAPDLKVVVAETYRQYAFVHAGEVWRLAYQMGDANYELVQRAAMTIGKPAMRFDLGHHMVLGPDSFLLERVTLVCAGDKERCQAMVTACTVITHGRAVETFRGELKATDGAVRVSGDRRYSGSFCSGR